MSDLLRRLQALGDAEHDDFSVAYDASEEIVSLRARVAELEAALLGFVSLGHVMGWDLSTTYRQELMKSGRAALEGRDDE